MWQVQQRRGIMNDLADRIAGLEEKLKEEKRRINAKEKKREVKKKREEEKEEIQQETNGTRTEFLV